MQAPLEPPSVAGKAVYVRTYTRFRFGKMEVVTDHFRSWPT